MLDKLELVNEKNSISSVTAEIFSPQTIIKPKDLIETLNKQDHFKRYAKKGVISSKEFNFSNFEVQTEPKEKEVGLVFEAFNDKGGVTETFKLENLNETRSSLSYITKSYDSWEVFLGSFLESVKSFGDKINLYVEGIKLTYVDQFNWIGDSEIDIESIFKKEGDSELLNKKFLSSKNGTIAMFSKTKQDLNIHEDKIEISFSNDVKRIVIEHQYAIRFSDVKRILDSLNGANNLKKIFSYAHDENKNVLKDILTEECQVKIGLKD
jgi:uncharacterized protein (TIGR04255 family)